MDILGIEPLTFCIQVERFATAPHRAWHHVFISSTNMVNMVNGQHLKQHDMDKDTVIMVITLPFI